MSERKLKIGFVRRGFSQSGGAENYLRRLAQGVVTAGHTVQLFTTREWPAHEWQIGELVTLRGETPIAFADELECRWRASGCDLLFSFERVWRCDLYRAGDGVHRAWLKRRARSRGLLARIGAKFNRKHAEILRLEDSLLRRRGAARVIANSKMVMAELAKFYDYPANRIDLIYNGVPLAEFAPRESVRAERRAALALGPDEIALLFVGSGWERKGLRVAIDAMKLAKNPRLRLFVAGRGNERNFQSPGVQFLGETSDLPALLAAADIFVLPTIYDPFSNACLEALAAGLPVITTRANGFGEIIDDGVHGSLVDDPANAKAFATAIQLWANDERRHRAHAAILERAAQFDISKNVAQTLEVLLQAAANAASASGKMRKT